MPRRRATKAEVEPPGPTGAMDIAVRFLATRPRTRHEIARRLRRAGASDDVVTVTLDRLAELGYADDAAFARWWAEQRDRHAPRGRRLVEAELRRSGVPPNVIEAFRSDHAHPEHAPEDEGLPATEDERADDALRRHLRGRPLPGDPRALQRIGMFLVRRGFDPETARRAIRSAGASDEDAESEG